MKNIKIYKNNCRKDVLSGLQLQKDRLEYNIGKTLFAASDKGNLRENQEDSVLILEHPKDNNIKLIAVADGVGGYSDGDLASNSVLKEIIYWFEKNDNFEDLEKIKESLEKLLKNVLQDKDLYIWAATTLSLALITKEKTLIANVGDSRVYTIKNSVLHKETKDDSRSEELLDENVIFSEQLQRFHKSNNIITKAITIMPGNNSLSYKIIDNNYDKILAVTDGITDCLSKQEIEEIINKSNKANIVSNLVNKSLIKTSVLEEEIKLLDPTLQKLTEELRELLDDDYYKTISAGKDNATAAIYVKK